MICHELPSKKEEEEEERENPCQQTSVDRYTHNRSTLRFFLVYYLFNSFQRFRRFDLLIHTYFFFSTKEAVHTLVFFDLFLFYPVGQQRTRRAQVTQDAKWRESSVFWFLFPRAARETITIKKNRETHIHYSWLMLNLLLLIKRTKEWKQYI